MFWLTDGEELPDVLVAKEPFALIDAAIAEEVVDKGGVELLDCDSLGRTAVDSFEDADTFWATLAVALCDFGSDWLAETGLLVVTETLADSLVEEGLGLALIDWVEAKPE